MEDSEDEIDSITKTAKIMNLSDMECYKYFPLPNPLIPKSLAQYDPPKFGLDFNFLQIGRKEGSDRIYN